MSKEKIIIEIPKDGSFVEILGHRIERKDKKGWQGFIEHLSRYAELEEKATPKKPYVSVGNISKLEAYFCSACNGYIRFIFARKEVLFEEHAYCGRCGQAFDWSDLNEHEHGIND